MHQASFHRKAVIFLLLATFAAPWASAAGSRSDEARAAKEAGPSLSLLGRISSFLTRIWSETGCHIDPSGGCAPEPRPTSWSDEGCMIDPNGRCRS
ncbi:MAG TPA: hypothetical protein VN493_22195 [Thermoanaerobaculia bacterium]|nr:hypothetical protein [Thermoanaerobaculia bacterium]